MMTSALSNCAPPGQFDDSIESVLAQYAPDYLGLCYDSGHANIVIDRLHRLERLKDPLIALHLNDNDGSADQHMLPFQEVLIGRTWLKLSPIRRTKSA